MNKDPVEQLREAIRFTNNALAQVGNPDYSLSEAISDIRDNMKQAADALEQIAKANESAAAQDRAEASVSGPKGNGVNPVPSAPPVQSAASGMPSKKQFLDRVIEELNLDVDDPLTNFIANAFALCDQREALHSYAKGLEGRLEEQKWEVMDINQHALEWEETATRFFKRAEAAEAKLAAAKKDAERYRWLKLACRNLDGSGHVCPKIFGDGASLGYANMDGKRFPRTPEGFDAAIDAAREGKEGE